MASDARSNAPLAFAREWFEIQYEHARARQDWSEARTIALRVVELLEQADFAEAHMLAVPLTVSSDDA